MGNVFKNIGNAVVKGVKDTGHAVAKGVKDTGNEIKRDVKRATGNDRPNPGAYSNMPTTNNGSSPYSSVPGQSPGGLPGQSGLPGSSSGFSSLPSGLPSGFNEQAFENSLRTDKDLSGVWQTIQGLGGDVWGVLTSFLPKNPDGSINWGAVGTDVVKWVKDNAQTIIEGAGAVANYQRQQKADDYAKQGLELAKQRFAENAPLRDAGRSGMLNPTANAPDLSGLRSISSVNPFSKGPIPLTPHAAPVPAPMPAPAAAPIPIPAPAAPHPTPVGTSPSHAIPLSLTAAPPAPLAAPTPNTLPAAPGRPIPLTGVRPQVPIVPRPKPIPLDMAAL